MARRIIVIDGTNHAGIDLIDGALSASGTMVGPLGPMDMRILPAEKPGPAFDLDIRLPREKPRRDWEQRQRRMRK